MVFPSVPPLYLDPTTWNQNPQQQLYHHQQQQLSNTASNTGNDHQNQLQPPGTSTSRANSMAERARLAKISMQPEGAPLPCPRCESTNTKFCYFNNYSLSQPRHFCKACRRYWTRGGALRNVPVGGGMRRNNKRSSKPGSSASAAAKTSTSSSTATSAAGMPASQPQLVNPAVMMTSAMTGYDTSVSVPNIGLGFSNMGLMSQIPQFPFLGGGLEQSASMVGNYPFLAGNGSSGSELPSQLESVKMEDSNRRRVLLNLERQYNLGMNVNNNNPRNENQLWGDQGSTTPGGVGGSGGGGGGGGGVGGWMANLSGFNLSSATGSLF